MATDGVTIGGVFARFLAALVLVYATYNPEGYSFYHWALLPLARGEGISSFNAGKFILFVLLIAGWVVFVQAARRSIGLVGALLIGALSVGVIWFLTERHLVNAGSTRVISHLALVIISLVLAIGMSWSHMQRRLTGQVDTDELN